MKRLRRHFPQSIRYFHVGEYGETTNRPHYHALIYGEDFTGDRKSHTRNAQGDTLFTSETLDKLWGYGHTMVGNLTYETAAYCARYVLKKITGEAAQEHYAQLDLETGEIHQRLPEYVTMSLKPAIGANWYEEYKSDIYPDDFVVSQGKKFKVPKYYDKKYQQEDATAAQKIKFQRIRNAQKRKSDNTPERLKDRETVCKSGNQLSKRTL